MGYADRVAFALAFVSTVVPCIELLNTIPYFRAILALLPLFILSLSQFGQRKKLIGLYATLISIFMAQVLIVYESNISLLANDLFTMLSTAGVEPSSSLTTDVVSSSLSSYSLNYIATMPLLALSWMIAHVCLLLSSFATMMSSTAASIVGAFIVVMTYIVDKVFLPMPTLPPPPGPYKHISSIRHRFLARIPRPQTEDTLYERYPASPGLKHAPTRDRDMVTQPSAQAPLPGNLLLSAEDNAEQLRKARANFPPQYWIEESGVCVTASAGSAAASGDASAASAGLANNDMPASPANSTAPLPAVLSTPTPVYETVDLVAHMFYPAQYHRQYQHLQTATATPAPAPNRTPARYFAPLHATAVARFGSMPWQAFIDVADARGCGYVGLGVRETHEGCTAECTHQCAREDGTQAGEVSTVCTGGVAATPGSSPSSAAPSRTSSPTSAVSPRSSPSSASSSAASTPSCATCASHASPASSQQPACPRCTYEGDDEAARALWRALWARDVCCDADTRAEAAALGLDARDPWEVNCAAELAGGDSADSNGNGSGHDDGTPNAAVARGPNASVPASPPSSHLSSSFSSSCSSSPSWSTFWSQQLQSLLRPTHTTPLQANMDNYSYTRPETAAVDREEQVRRALAALRTTGHVRVLDCDGAEVGSLGLGIRAGTGVEVEIGADMSSPVSGCRQRVRAHDTAEENCVSRAGSFGASATMEEEKKTLDDSVDARDSSHCASPRPESALPSLAPTNSGDAAVAVGAAVPGNAATVGADVGATDDLSSGLSTDTADTAALPFEPSDGACLCAHGCPPRLRVCLYAHGLGGGSEIYTSSCMALASHGYLVVAITFTDATAACALSYTDTRRWFDGGRAANPYAMPTHPYASEHGTGEAADVSAHTRPAKHLRSGEEGEVDEDVSPDMDAGASAHVCSHDVLSTGDIATGASPRDCCAAAASEVADTITTRTSTSFRSAAWTQSQQGESMVTADISTSPVADAAPRMPSHLATGYLSSAAPMPRPALMAARAEWLRRRDASDVEHKSLLGLLSEGAHVMLFERPFLGNRTTPLAEREDHSARAFVHAQVQRRAAELQFVLDMLQVAAEAQWDPDADVSAMTAARGILPVRLPVDQLVTCTVCNDKEAQAHGDSTSSSSASSSCFCARLRARLRHSLGEDRCTLSTFIPSLVDTWAPTRAKRVPLPTIDGHVAPAATALAEAVPASTGATATALSYLTSALRTFFSPSAASAPQPPVPASLLGISGLRQRPPAVFVRTNLSAPSATYLRGATLASAPPIAFPADVPVFSLLPAVPPPPVYTARRVTLAGHSFGGATSLTAASRMYTCTKVAVPIVVPPPPTANPPSSISTASAASCTSSPLVLVASVPVRLPVVSAAVIQDVWLFPVSQRIIRQGPNIMHQRRIALDLARTHAVITAALRTYTHTTAEVHRGIVHDPSAAGHATSADTVALRVDQRLLREHGITLTAVTLQQAQSMGVLPAHNGYALSGDALGNNPDVDVSLEDSARGRVTARSGDGHLGVSCSLARGAATAPCSPANPAASTDTVFEPATASGADASVGVSPHVSSRVSSRVSPTARSLPTSSPLASSPASSGYSSPRPRMPAPSISASSSSAPSSPLASTSSPFNSSASVAALTRALGVPLPRLPCAVPLLSLVTYHWHIWTQHHVSLRSMLVAARNTHPRFTILDQDAAESSVAMSRAGSLASPSNAANDGASKTAASATAPTNTASITTTTAASPPPSLLAQSPPRALLAPYPSRTYIPATPAPLAPVPLPPHHQIFAHSDKGYPYAKASQQASHNHGALGMLVRATRHADFADCAFWAPVVVQKLGIVGPADKARSLEAYGSASALFADCHSGNRNDTVLCGAHAHVSAAAVSGGDTGACADADARAPVDPRAEYGGEALFEGALAAREALFALVRDNPLVSVDEMTDLYY